MRKTIWKYQLKETDTQIITAPEDAVFVHVGAQQNKLCLWAIVEPHKRQRDYTIIIHGTGHPVLPNLTYIGTVQHPPFVWHIFLQELL